MKSHQSFCDKFEFPFPLLVDEERRVAQTYGTLKENGRSIQRKVVIVDKESTVRNVKQGRPPDHQLLDIISGF